MNMMWFKSNCFMNNAFFRLTNQMFEKSMLKKWTYWSQLSKNCHISWMLLLNFFNIFLGCLTQNIKCVDV